MRLGGPQGRGGVRGQVSTAGSWPPAGRTHRPSGGEFGVQGSGGCVPAPQPAVLPVEGATVGLRLLWGRGTVPPLLCPEGPSLSVAAQAVVLPSAACWAALMTTVAELGWRVLLGWGLCLTNLVSPRPQTLVGGHRPLPRVEGDRGSELEATSLHLPPTLLEKHRSLPNPQPLERTEPARGAHRAWRTLSVVSGRGCPCPPCTRELDHAWISLGTGNALEDMVILEAGPKALIPQGWGL